MIKVRPLEDRLKIIDMTIGLALPSMNPDDFEQIDSLLNKLKKHLIECDNESKKPT